MSLLMEFAWYLTHPRPGDVTAGLLTVLIFGCIGVMVWLGLAG